VRNNARWLGAGFLMTLGSSFGQTYFISLFGADIRAFYGLSHGDFGGLYTIATAASAMALIFIGKLADRWPVAGLSAAVAVALGIGCLVMANARSLVLLVIALFLLRLFGQGMMTHISMTAMGRWFEARRGRAVAMASFGFPAGEAFFPLLAVALIPALGWRGTWVAAAMVMIFVAAPVFYLLTYRNRTPRFSAEDVAVAVTDRRQWTASEVRRDWLPYALFPGLLAPAFIVTSVFFHQAHLAAAKGWSIEWIAASYPFYAATSVLGSIAAGWLVDRGSARSFLPVMLMPLCVALAIFGLGTHPLTAFAAFAFFGLSAGFMVSISGTLWAELYGTRHLGAIRALVVAAMVLSTAVGPSITGYLIDAGLGVGTLLIVMAAYCIAASIPPLFLQDAMAERAEAPVPSRT
ncbi:MAG: MFS transporter, partial [Pseudomonadota bacterium]